MRPTPLLLSALLSCGEAAPPAVPPALLARGEPCASDAACAPGLACDLVSTPIRAATRTCEPPCKETASASCVAPCGQPLVERQGTCQPGRPDESHFRAIDWCGDCTLVAARRWGFWFAVPRGTSWQAICNRLDYASPGVQIPVESCRD